MTISSDNSMRRGHGAFRPAGTGVALTINCMPCGGRFGNPIGGKRFRWRGVMNVWHCPSCVEKREQKAKAA